MKHALTCLAIVLPLAMPLHHVAAEASPIAARQLSVEQVIELKQASISDRVIMKQIEVTGSRFALDAEGLLALNRAGAGEALLLCMIDALQTPPPAGPQPASAGRESIYEQGLTLTTAGLPVDPKGPDDRLVGLDISTSGLAVSPKGPDISAAGLDLYPEVAAGRGKLIVQLVDSTEDGWGSRIKDPAAARLMLRLVASSELGEREFLIESAQRDARGYLVIDHPASLALLLPPGEHRLVLELLGVPMGSNTPQVLASDQTAAVNIREDSERSLRFVMGYRNSWSEGETWNIQSDLM